jgi:hypothetical protein
VGELRIEGDGEEKGRMLNTAIWAAVIAALTTLAGYLVSQSWSRRERYAKVYAEALGALRRWEEIPYVISVPRVGRTMAGR